jgi:hypothetical protein
MIEKTLTRRVLIIIAILLLQLLIHFRSLLRLKARYTIDNYKSFKPRYWVDSSGLPWYWVGSSRLQAREEVETPKRIALTNDVNLISRY